MYLGIFILLFDLQEKTEKKAGEKKKGLARFARSDEKDMAAAEQKVQKAQLNSAAVNFTLRCLLEQSELLESTKVTKQRLKQISLRCAHRSS